MKVQILVILSLIVCSYSQNRYPRSLVVWPLLFEFETPRLTSGECCSDFLSNTTCTTFCTVYLMLHHNGKTTRIADVPYPIKTMIWENEETHVAQYLEFEQSMEFTLRAHESVRNELVDVWVVQVSMDALTGNMIFDHRLGQFGNAKISMLLKWACPGHYGTNCLRSCPIQNTNAYCDSTGAVLCRAPFVGPPNCRNYGSPCDDRPCKNGGSCQTNPENNLDFVCTCPLAYGGKTCDRPSCTQASCGNGTCIEGACVCETGFMGDNCDSIRCESGICQNRGRCTVESDKHLCECPSENVLGEFCQFRCRPGCLNGVCTINKNNDDAFCKCFNGFGGYICDIPLGSGGSGNKVSGNVVQIVVPIVVVLVVLVTSGLLVYFLVFKKKMSGMKMRSSTKGSVEEM